MPKRNLAEYLLVRAVGPARAGAIHGDLLELAATRGRVWFCATYLRTLLSLTWRGPAAFLIACAVFTLMSRYQIYVFIYTARFYGRLFPLPHLYVSMVYNLSTFQLWFVVPFAAVKYGVSDRFVRVGAGVLAGMSAGFCCIAAAPGMPLAVAAGALLAMTALAISPRWRGAAIALAATSAVGLAVNLNLQNLAHLFCWVYEGKPLNASSHYHYFETGYAFPHTIFWMVTWGISLLNMLVLATVFSRLHERFELGAKDVAA